MKFIGIFDHEFILCHLDGVLYAIDLEGMVLLVGPDDLISHEIIARLRRWG